MTSPLHAPNTQSDGHIVAMARVPAGQLRDALGPLVLRERLQKKAEIGSGSSVQTPTAAIRIVYQPHLGLTLQSQDGRMQTPLPGVSVEASSAVTVEVSAKELQNAVAELSIGLDTDETAFALASDHGSTSIETVGVRPIGRATVLNAITAAHLTANSSLPLLAAFALRAAGLQQASPEAPITDPSLLMMTEAMRQSLSNREYEIWTDETPAWVLAGTAVLGAYDTAAQTSIITAAEHTIATELADTLDLSSMEREACYTMVLFAACHDGRRRVPAPVLSAVPLAVATSLVAWQSLPTSQVARSTLIPSERQRYAVLTSHAGLTAAAPAAALAHPLLGHTTPGEETGPDVETRRYIDLLAKGEVREIQGSFALRLTAVPAHVLRGALLAHGCLAHEALQSLSADDRARTEMVSAAWPAACTLAPPALEQIATATGRTAIRLDSLLQQQARQKRQDAQRRDRRLTVAHLVPNDIAMGTSRRVCVRSMLHGPTDNNLRVADVEASTSPACQGVSRTLHLPPAAFGLAAVDAGVPVVCNLEGDTAVILAPGSRCPDGRQQTAVLGTWSAHSTTTNALAILRGLQTAPPSEIVMLWGDEVIAARAAATSGRATPANPGEGLPLPVVLSPSGTRIDAGGSTISLGPERASLLNVIRDGIQFVAALANPVIKDGARRFAVAENALREVTTALTTAAARQGVGRTEHHVDGPGLHPANARVSIAASVGTGYLSVHDGIRESVISEAAFQSAATPTRVSMAPTAIVDALDIAVASGTAQEVRRASPRGTAVIGSAQLRFSDGGDGLSIERGRATVMAVAIQTDHPDARVMDEYAGCDEPTSITMVSVRAGM